MKCFRLNNVKNGAGVSAEQKYGPMTTRRRNDALLKRRNLIRSNEITSGYVAFPAKLMVKIKPSDKGYKLHTDFSNTEVIFKKRSEQS